MADEVDEASDTIELEIALARLNLRATPVSVPVGACQNCAEDFPPGDFRIFCDQDCELDFRRRQWALKMKA